MYEDLSADLANQITRRFEQIMDNHTRADSTLKAIVKRMKAGKATQMDVNKYADFVGRAGSSAMKQVLKLEALPDATMYKEIADQTITPVLERMWQNVNSVALNQMKAEDATKGLNIGIRTGFNPKRRIAEVVNMVAGQTTQEAIDNALTDPVIATARKYYDDFLMENADLRESLGFNQRVIRHYDDKGLRFGTKYAEPCQWCLAREGEWSMAEAHANGVFNRHPGCGCTIVVFYPDHTDVQVDWTRNEWSSV